jgi:hypothetical protein
MDAICDAVQADTASPPGSTHHAYPRARRAGSTAHPRTVHDRPTTQPGPTLAAPTHHVQALHSAPTSQAQPGRSATTSRAFSTVHAHDCTAHIRYSPRTTCQAMRLRLPFRHANPTRLTAGPDDTPHLAYSGATCQAVPVPARLDPTSFRPCCSSLHGPSPQRHALPTPLNPERGRRRDLQWGR